MQQAISTYDAASPDLHMTWAVNYDEALATITPSGGAGGDMSEGTHSPDYTKD